MNPGCIFLLPVLLGQYSPSQPQTAAKPIPGVIGGTVHIGVAITPDLFYEAVILHHGKLHPESKDPKVVSLDRIADTGSFEYLVSDAAGTVYRYRTTYDIHGFSGWEATVQGENADHSLIASDQEHYSFRRLELIDRPARPAYPISAKFAHVTGQVTADLTVGTDGRVESVAQQKGSSFFSKVATQYAKQCVFKPATLNGVPQKDHFTLNLNFQLKAARAEGATTMSRIDDVSTLLTKEDLSEAYARAVQAWKDDDLKLAKPLLDGIERRDPTYKMVQYYLGVMDLHMDLLDSGKARMKRVLEASDPKAPFLEQSHEVQEAAIVLADMKDQGL